MVVMENMSSRPRIQRFWIRCPAPGIYQPKAGASTDMVVIGCVVVEFFTSSVFGLLADEFAIQMVTISF
jgi:hypothetical protein